MAKVIYIPNGPGNLKSLFPEIDFDNIQEYFVELLDELTEVVATTVINKMGCCCNNEQVRIHFLNYLGTFDAINFNKPIVVHEAVSGEFKNALSNPLQKTDTGIERHAVKANDTKQARNNCYSEDDMLWVQELIDSPKAFEEWTGKQGQADSYLPIRILDKKFDKQKNDKEYSYPFLIEYKMSNENQIIRN